MILSFKKQFQEKILDGSKIHTIRLDPNHRWQAGKKIHFATGVRTPKYNCFKEDVCQFIQAIDIRPDTRQIFIGRNGTMNELPNYLHHFFALADGFDDEEGFWKWFNKPFFGVLIHWTETVY